MNEQDDRVLIAILQTNMANLTKEVSLLSGAVAGLPEHWNKLIEDKVNERVHRAEFEPWKNIVRGFLMAIIAGFIGFLFAVFRLRLGL